MNENNVSCKISILGLREKSIFLADKYLPNPVNFKRFYLPVLKRFVSSNSHIEKNHDPIVIEIKSAKNKFCKIYKY